MRGVRTRESVGTGAMAWALVLIAGTLWGAGSAVARADGTGAAASPDVPATAEDFNFARKLSRVFKTVAEQCEPSVVHITQLRNVPALVDFFGRPIRRGGVQTTGLGSGVIVDSSGLILTNNHVIRGAEQLKVKLADGREFEAQVVGRDEPTDLAVLRINPQGESLRAAGFADSDQIDVGEWVVAIGSPFGLDSSVTAGIISAKGRTVTPRETGVSYEDYIQTDAAINPGNSGGPLLNLEGRIVGINTAIASRTGGYDGIGFAIPSNTARAVLENIVRNGRVVRGWLGVETGDAQRGAGAIVQRVMETSPAAAAGLQPGDVITHIGTTPVGDGAKLRNTVSVLSPGTEVALRVRREGEDRTVSVRLGDLTTSRGNAFVRELGVEVARVPARVTNRLGLRDGLGVQVVQVDDNGRGARDGLQAGDLVVAVDEQSIDGPASFERLVGQSDLAKGVRLNVIRPRTGERGYVVVRDEE